MQRWSDPSATPAELRPCVATLGNFDGVHRGHQAVLDALLLAGRNRDLPSVVVTFQPHPVQVLRPDLAPPLVAPEPVRDELIADSGVDGLLVMEFTKDLAATSPEDFVAQVFVEALQAQVVVVGADTRFGARNAGDVTALSELAERYGFEVVVLQDLGEDGERWSSTAVRGHLSEGDVKGASTILGRPHRVQGRVVHGNHRGRGLGFPTANLEPDTIGMVPAEGVYAGWLTRIEQPPGTPDRTMPAAISIGTNPTFDTRDRRTVEAHVLDRDDLDLYGETVVVEFIERIRPMLRFESIDELLEAMSSDVRQSREILATIVP